MIACPTLTPPEARYWTPPRLAKLWGVKTQKVLGFIRSGQLVAINLGEGKLRPRWKIAPSAIEQFEAARTSRPAVKPAARRRRADPSVIQFF